MGVFDNFNRIGIINLPRRQDRRKEMNRQLAKVGLLGEPRVAYWDAVASTTSHLFYSKGARGCFLSHRSLIADAAMKGQSLLILEDDCDFTPAVHDPLPPFDFLWGGWNEASHPHDMENCTLLTGSHFIGMTAETVRKCNDYLSCYLEDDFEPDPISAAEPGYNPNIRPGSDGAYTWFRRAHPEITTVFKELGVQRPSRTDVGQNRWFDRTPVIRSVVETARRIRA